MPKKEKLSTLIFQQRVLVVLLFTITAIMVWVGFSIYFSYEKTTLTSVDQKLISPLNPRLDSNLFSTLSQRKSWSVDELNSFTPSVELAPQSTPTPLPEPTIAPSATPAPNNTLESTPNP